MASASRCSRWPRGLGVDHQQLQQQFVTSSTWDYVEVRRRLALWVDAFIDPQAWIIDDTGFPKDGVRLPGWRGALGKTGNSQIGVSVHGGTDWASAAVNWRLFLPESGDDTAAGNTANPAVAEQIRARRARAGIGEQVRHLEKWRLALDMLDQLTEWGLPPGRWWPTPATAMPPNSASP
jgi:SRSO17 transposase